VTQNEFQDNNNIYYKVEKRMNRKDFLTLIALIDSLNKLGCDFKDIMTKEQADKFLKIHETKFIELKDKEKLIEELKKTLQHRLKNLK
jgi:hypothetical protein